MLCDIVRARHLDACIVDLTLCFTESHGQACLLLGEQVGSDLVGVVQAQQIAALGHQLALMDRAKAQVGRPWGGRARGDPPDPPGPLKASPAGGCAGLTGPVWHPRPSD